MKIWRFIPLCLLPGLLAGCTEEEVRPLAMTQPIDPPPRHLETAWIQASEQRLAMAAAKPERSAPGPTAPTVQTAPVAQPTPAAPAAQGTGDLYLFSAAGYVVPYSVPLRQTQKQAQLQEAVQALVTPTPGAGAARALPEGFTYPLPAGTKVLQVEEKAGKVKVDFSEQFLHYKPEQERNLLSALVWTLTSFPEVSEVNLFVKGKALSTMPHHAAPAMALKRTNVGINMETLQGVHPKAADQVVLYFLYQDSHNKIYYVPVTRMIARTKDDEDRADGTTTKTSSNASGSESSATTRTERLLKEVLGQLIKEGPRPYSGLVSALDSDMKVQQVSLRNQVATVVFAGDQRELNQASDQAVRALVLSLTEQVGVERVRIVYGTGAGKAATSPQDHLVVRPRVINSSAS